MLKVQAILQDGSVALEFITDDPSEAEQTRRQLLAVEGVAEVGIMDAPGWVRCDQQTLGAPGPQSKSQRTVTETDCPRSPVELYSRVSRKSAYALIGLVRVCGGASCSQLALPGRLWLTQRHASKIPSSQVFRIRSLAIERNSRISPCALGAVTKTHGIASL